MKKIISLFQRNYETDRLVRNEVVPGAEWVISGEGVATRKFDGTCCLVRDGKLYKRYEVKQGKKTPTNFEPANEIDETTGKQQGWVPVGEGPEDKWHREAIAYGEKYTVPVYDNLHINQLNDKTFELCGPNIQGNPEGFAVHVLLEHGCDLLGDVPRNFDDIKAWLATQDIEGIVWHHPDGRMAKIKKKDFGLKRKPV